MRPTYLCVCARARRRFAQKGSKEERCRESIHTIGRDEKNNTTFVGTGPPRRPSVSSLALRKETTTQTRTHSLKTSPSSSLSSSRVSPRLYRPSSSSSRRRQSLLVLVGGLLSSPSSSSSRAARCHRRRRRCRRLLSSSRFVDTFEASFPPAWIAFGHVLLKSRQKWRFKSGGGLSKRASV